MAKKFKKVLLIDDDDSLNKVLTFQLGQMNFEVTSAYDGKAGLNFFKVDLFDIVITDLQLPDISGMELVKVFRRINKNVIIIIITAFGTIENAIEAVKLGADDYLTKPFSKESLRFVIEKVIQLQILKDENIHLKSELRDKFNFKKIVAKSALMDDVLKLTAQVASSETTVLIRGESGTGKELIARAIHYNSPRKDKPLITVNCPSIPENLMESELFGHVRGAFTGAMKDRKGKFELADMGTIFLDEIGDLKLDLQARLLRVLQEKEFERVGDSIPLKADVRVVAATNKNLEELVSRNLFREDLYYRLNVVTIKIPPLRDRKEDIPALVDFFVKKYAHEKQVKIDKNTLKTLIEYDWPGNVRELENAIERAIVISADGAIFSELLMLDKNMIKRSGDDLQQTTGKTLDQIERQAIENALTQTKGNQTRAAKILDIPRHVLIYRMKKLGIN